MNQSDRAMLGTHRGEPVVLLSLEDATSRGIDEGAAVRVHNDISSFVAQANANDPAILERSAYCDVVKDGKMLHVLTEPDAARVRTNRHAKLCR